MVVLLALTLPTPSLHSAEPVAANAATHDGWVLIDEGLHARAIPLFQSALELRPASPRAYAGRAVCHLHLGHYDRGIVDLKAAIRCHPNDCGIGYRARTNKALSRAALKHGERQVRQMLADRPAMAAHVKPHDTLWLWAARQFAGEGTGVTIDWDPTPPRGTDAKHSVPTENRRGRIFIKNLSVNEGERGEAFEDLWACAVFELHNIAYANEFKAAYDEALEGKVTKAEFVFNLFEIEYRAAQQTRAFYASVYLPWAKSRNLPTKAFHWYVFLMWDEPTKAFRKYTDPSSYPWYPYGGYFLKTQGHSHLVNERYGEAIQAYQQYIEQAKYPDEIAGAWEKIAYAWIYQKDYKQALEALDAAAKKAPADYDSKRLNRLFEWTLSSFFKDLCRRGSVEDANNVGKRYLAKFPRGAFAPVIRTFLEETPFLDSEPGKTDLVEFLKDKA